MLTSEAAMLLRVYDAAKKYRAEEQADTPRLWRGKKLHDLGIELDAAIEDYAALADGVKV